MTDLAQGLARRSTIRHPTKITIETPLLVPSFSSKGFQVTKESSAVQEAFDLSSEWLTETMLVSAYDIAHKHISQPEDLIVTPDLIIVDSGGYEMRFDHDMSTAVHWPHQPLPWDEARYQTVLDNWPERLSASFVSFDDPSKKVPLVAQIDSATNLFARHSNQLHTFLLKPETEEQRDLGAAIDSVIMAPETLAPFDFIGVTEKELGNSLLSRMHNIARLRTALDRADVGAPIHVFGALDPLACILFFLAGAEVFDGLTWLRYAFRDGLCIYQSNYGALEVGTDRRDDLVRARIYTDNVHYLQKMSGQMRKFLLDRDFARFGHHAEFLRDGYDSLRARLQGGT
jgi:hypothetical protein